MIHIIGTCHKTQVWNDLVKKQPLGVIPLAKINAQCGQIDVVTGTERRTAS